MQLLMESVNNGNLMVTITCRFRLRKYSVKNRISRSHYLMIISHLAVIGFVIESFRHGILGYTSVIHTEELMQELTQKSLIEI